MPAVKTMTPKPRVLRKGAINFGLAHVPVALHAASVARKTAMRRKAA
ncbi:hypothetical protein [Variovorax sp. DT-64]